MKKYLIVGILLSFASFSSLNLLYAAADRDKTFNEIKTELHNKGIATKDIDSVNSSVAEMLEKGASKAEIEKPLSDLSANGVKGEDFKKSVDSMNALVKSGKSPKEAGNIVSQAVHQAQAEGLRGTALADRVHQAIKEMQTQKRESIESKLKQTEAGNVSEKTEGSSEQRSLPSEGHGMGHMGGGHGHR